MPILTPVRPKPWRVALAFLITPGFASLILAAVMPHYDGLPVFDRVLRTAFLFAVFGAYPPTVVVGVPLYLILKDRLAPSLFHCGWAGAVTAALPTLCIQLAANPTYAYSGGHVTHDHGMRTLWGWVELTQVTSWMALVGALTGAAFWLIAVCGTRQPRTAADVHLSSALAPGDAQ